MRRQYHRHPATVSGSRTRCSDDSPHTHRRASIAVPALRAGSELRSTTRLPLWLREALPRTATGREIAAHLQCGGLRPSIVGKSGVGVVILRSEIAWRTHEADCPASCKAGRALLPAPTGTVPVPPDRWFAVAASSSRDPCQIEKMMPRKSPAWRRLGPKANFESRPDHVVTSCPWLVTTRPQFIHPWHFARMPDRKSTRLNSSHRT